MPLFSETDLPAFKRDRVLQVAASYLPGVQVSDEYLMERLVVAERDVGRRLKVLLTPTTIFPYAPTEAEIATLTGGAWLEEPGYDYDASFFQQDRWGFLVLNERPVISVDYVRFSYPGSLTPHLYDLPDNWIRIDKKAGQLRVVPVGGGSYTAPLAAFVMQVMGRGGTIPYLLQVRYVAGLANARRDWPDLVDVIKRVAVLGIIEDQYVPQSGSISGDGLSQSLSVDTAKYDEIIETKLFGPKGSNGGLFTAIHGMLGTVAGSVS